MRIESRHLLPSLVLAGGFAAVLYLEILWIGSQEVFNIDGQVLYAAGRAWLQGANPYDFDALSRSIAGVPGLNLDTGINAIRFFYPPQSAGFCVPLGLLPYLLAFFAGSFLYIGASDLLPEAREHDSPLVAVATCLGMLAIFLVTHLLRG